MIDKNEFMKLPDISNCKTTKEKIYVFLECINDETVLNIIYKTVKTFFFY